MQTIELYKNLGPVVFLGGVNAMPMMYALELKKKGINVLYFVDAPASDALSRPENHFKDIEYPYPEWIVESVLPTQIVMPLFPRLFAYLVRKNIEKKTKIPPQAIFLNGFFCSLAPYFLIDVPKIFLPGGSDLDSWADTDGASSLSQSFLRRSIFKYIPSKISGWLIKKIVQRQFFGASKCAKVLYFPKGFNDAGDRVTQKLEEVGVDILARYDVSFDPLKYEERGVVSNNGRMVIFSGVRFLFKTFPDGNKGYGKGNDLIIRGLAQYFLINKNIEIHFVEKGEDVAEAKRLCAQLGLDDVVTWHKEMKFIELLRLYRMADVCFDQVGENWVAAIGFYALWLGKPLIANDRRAVDAGVWGMDAPILSASTADEIVFQLRRLDSFEMRKKISVESIRFADAELGPGKALGLVFAIKG